MNESNMVFDSIQLIPLGESEISPLITKVKIKVFHLGLNRNRSYIDKDTALKMAESLRGCPIVGNYRKDKGDFTDHGEQITINDEGIKVECLTKPYGFVDLNAKVWFEDYIDIDEFGNQLQHTYLVTEGIVWTEQYPELKESLCLDGARPQSMELHEQTLKGNWSKDYNSGIEFFIINEALITKLCILGEDVEPCFIGSTVSLEDKNEMFNFSLNKDFGLKLYNMMQELNLALKGELKMTNEQISAATEEEKNSTNFEKNCNNVVQNEVTENKDIVESNFEVAENVVSEEVTETEVVNVETDFTESEVVESVTDVTESVVETEFAEVKIADSIVETEEPVVETEFKEKEEEKSSEKDSEEKKEDTEFKCGEKEEDEDKKKYSLLEEEYNNLKNQFSELEAKYQALVEFKTQVEEKEKDSLINSFSMLDEKEKEEIIQNKSKFSLEEIESKLSVIFARKQMNANNVEVKEVQTEEVPLIYTEKSDLSLVPDWVKAVQETAKNL